MSNNKRVLANEIGLDAAAASGARASEHTTRPLQRSSIDEVATDRRLYRLFLVAGDGMVLFLAFTLAYWLRFQVGIALDADVIPSPMEYLQLTVTLISMWLVLFAAMGLYDFHNLLGGVTEYVRVANACTVGMFSVVLFSFANPEFVVALWLGSAGMGGIDRDGCQLPAVDAAAGVSVACARPFCVADADRRGEC